MSTAIGLSEYSTTTSLYPVCGMEELPFDEWFSGQSAIGGCEEPNWHPHYNCGYSLAQAYPPDFFEPWKFIKTDAPFFKDLDALLAGITSPRERAEIITQKASRLPWRWQPQPTGISPDAVLVSSPPKGNCVDATNFLLAVLKHYHVPAQPVYVSQTNDFNSNHVCVKLVEEAVADNESIVELLLDLTRTPPIAPAHKAWSDLGEREFAALVFNAKGIGSAAKKDFYSAHRFFSLAEETCNELPTAHINQASYYLRTDSLDLAEAGPRLLMLEEQGYESPSLYGALYFYYLRLDRPDLAQAYLDLKNNLCEPN